MVPRGSDGKVCCVYSRLTVQLACDLRQVEDGGDVVWVGGLFLIGRACVEGPSFEDEVLKEGRSSAPHDNTSVPSQLLHSSL